LILKEKGKTMDAKGRKVLNGLTKLGGEQEVFDLSIAVKMTEDAVQERLKALSEEGLVSCRRDDGGKEFWSVAEAKAAPAADSGGKEPVAAAGKKKSKATAAGPDDRFDEFILDPKAAASPAPIPSEPSGAEVDSFEPAPAAKEAPVVEEAEFEPITPKAESAAKDDDSFEPKPEKEKPAKAAKKRAASPDAGPAEPKPAKESKTERKLSAGPDDRFDEFAERVHSKPSLPIPLMAGAAALVIIVILFIVGGGGKTKKSIKTAVEDVRTEFTGKLDSLKAATTADIGKVRAENKALRDEINAIKAELKKSANRGPDTTPAADKKPDKPADKPKPAQGNNRKR
jgi:DNA-binding transcriptional ArsR family regulator